MAGAAGRSRRGAGDPRSGPSPQCGLSGRLSMRSDTQSRFAAALLNNGRGIPQGLASWSGAEPVQRFVIYRNNVAHGLARALAARFPACVRIVGEEFFSAMARAFIERHPPRSPILLAY